MAMSPAVWPLCSFLDPSHANIQNIAVNPTTNLDMAAQSVTTKRATCLVCSKPTRVCLCNRFKSPPLNNSVTVTILQHSLERSHPLNSARIAKLGLKHVDIFTVSDVNFQASFFLQLLNSNLDGKHHMFDKMPSKEFVDICNDESLLVDEDELPRVAIDFTIEKHGNLINQLNQNEQSNITNFDQLFSSVLGYGDIRKGFSVTKLQRYNNHEDSEEFNIKIPPGSVLLFPSEESVDIQDIGFEVKNLIVLDGTWAKAKRMYNENPWLKLVPHIRLDLETLSLYGEVRRQPRAGYLSTIESIVYALKVVGEGSKGLDCLLDVFESMVGDQRRCQNERLSKLQHNLIGEKIKL